MQVNVIVMNRQEKKFMKDVKLVWAGLNKKQRTFLKKMVRDGRYEHSHPNTCLIGSLKYRFFGGSLSTMAWGIKVKPKILHDIMFSIYSKYGVERANEIIPAFIREARV